MFSALSNAPVVTRLALSGPTQEPVFLEVMKGMVAKASHEKLKDCQEGQAFSPPYGSTAS